MFPNARLVASLALVLLASLLAAAGADTIVIDEAWCKVTAPEKATAGGPFPVTVEYSGIEPRSLLCVDLHWQKTDGSYGGFLAWGGPYPEVAGNGRHTFSFRIAAQEGLGAISVLVFLSPDGSFDKRTKETRGQAVPVSGEAPTYKKSWVWIDTSAVERELVEGQSWEVPVEYYLDPSEDDGGTAISLWGAGPWIDCPDGTYTKERHHVSYPGTSRRIEAKPGRHREVVAFRVPPALARNSILLIANFRDAGGKDWPWHVRSRDVYFHRAGGFFELQTDRPGNLFTYDEAVRIGVRLLDNAVSPAGELSYKVTDVRGEQVTQGTVDLTDGKPGQVIPVELRLERRGTFLIEVEVPGWETRYTTFARIPDVMQITGGAPTRFGMTNVVTPSAPERTERLCQIARRLGLTSCRSFTNWYEIEPGPDEYRLEAWDRAIEIANRNGISAWLCIVSPPAWAQRGAPEMVGYRPFQGDVAAWTDMVRTVTARYKGRFLGWEWLNEILPGGSPTPVDDYLELVKAGTAAVRATDPDARILLAGGLWPRTFRQAVLKAGVAEHIDVLPVHYSTGGGIAEARSDLVIVGAQRVEVWDNETARGLSIWDAPPQFDLQHTLQSNWILTNWADELCAGAQRIIYFGGEGDPAGNWSYLLDDTSPRPVAATLAVFISKVHDATPLGVFAFGKGGVFHLFDNHGKAVLIASSTNEGETVPLRVGSEHVEVVDYQGNPTPVAAPGGVAPLKLGETRVYVDGADLDVLKSYLVPQVLTRQAPQIAQGALKGTTSMAGTPHLTMLRGQRGSLRIGLRNLYDRELSGSLEVGFPEGWEFTGALGFSLQPGANATLPLLVDLAPDAEPGDYPVSVRVRFAWDKLPVVEKPAIVSVISPESLGNQLVNGDFEQPETPGAPAGWSGNAERVAADPVDEGLGRHSLKFTGITADWQHETAKIAVRAGQSYLYTAWVWNQDMHAGSNLTLHFADGTERALYDVNVFTCGEANPSWQVYSARFEAPEGTETVSVTPVVRGAGWALFDNLRVSAYEGSDYAADALRVATPPAIDGDLSDWRDREPLPLIGKNQLTALAAEYAWTPGNLSAVGYVRWDDENLYVAVRVRDDAHHPATGEETSTGDSLTLAFDPTGRGQDCQAKAFVYYVSSLAPGGGSGKHTLYRPADRAGGRTAGHLARDSSVHELAVARGEGLTTYELRIPFAELGISGPQVGAKLGLSVQVNDGDGQGLAATMGWGEGLQPAWAPGNLGIVTLLP